MIICGDVLTELRKLPDESIHCCVTSPPYWGLRDYGTAKWEGGDLECEHKVGRATRGGLTQFQANNKGSFGDEAIRQGECCPHCGAIRIDSQLGLERTPEEYVARMVEVFREVRRVLRKDGTLWLNLGDSYNANQGAGFDTNKDGGSRKAAAASPRIKWGKPKDLVGIPWRVAFALQADGWWLRQDIIWAKPNPMPESVRDRCTKAHEYIFLLAKSAKYYYDAEAVKEPLESSPLQNKWQRERPDGMKGLRLSPMPGDKRITVGGRCGGNVAGRNLRSVWTVTTKPFKEAHFATFPPEIPELCIKAGCPLGGTVLDPFFGAGTTGMVAKQLGRDFIGIELNPKYCEMAKRRIAQAGYQMEIEARPA